MKVSSLVDKYIDSKGFKSHKIHMEFYELTNDTLKLFFPNAKDSQIEHDVNSFNDDDRRNVYERANYRAINQSGVLNDLMGVYFQKFLFKTQGNLDKELNNQPEEYHHNIIKNLITKTIAKISYDHEAFDKKIQSLYEDLDSKGKNQTYDRPFHKVAAFEGFIRDRISPGVMYHMANMYKL